MCAQVSKCLLVVVFFEALVEVEEVRLTPDFRSHGAML
jgi:hypothetical protein